MTPTWEQVRGLNFSTMGRNARAVAHISNGDVLSVRHAPRAYWRVDDLDGSPTLVQNRTDRWTRNRQGTMVHTNSPHGRLLPDLEDYGHWPTTLLRAYDLFPISAANTRLTLAFSEPGDPEPATVRGRDGWLVHFVDRSRHLDENSVFTIVFDAALGIAVRWQRDAQWVELEDPVLDETLEPDTFIWAGPSLPGPDHTSAERARRKAFGTPEQLPTWLPLRTTVHTRAGDPRTGEFTVEMETHSPYLTVCRWSNNATESTDRSRAEQVPLQGSRVIGHYTYEVRSHTSIPPDACAQILDSIAASEPPAFTGDPHSGRTHDPAALDTAICNHPSERTTGGN